MRKHTIEALQAIPFDELSKGELRSAVMQGLYPAERKQNCKANGCDEPRHLNNAHCETHWLARLRSERQEPCECGNMKTKRSISCTQCRNKRRSGSASPHWRGGRRRVDGYTLIHSPDHPNKNRNGYVREHILVMEKHLGRLIMKPETIHHKNGHRSDNRIENLELWSSSQPSGQRVEDKALWCKEFMTQYPEYFVDGCSSS